MPFFPFYTDHGPEHVTDVLRSAEALVADQAWAHLTPEDAGILILSTLLHDAALHLREEGFVAIAKGEWQPVLHASFGDRPWRELWDEYTSEVRRWDSKRLHGVFGSKKPASIPEMEYGAIPEWTQRDRLLIGEFLRRHHHRIAHDIVTGGVPGPLSSKRLSLDSSWGDYGDLAGIIARSHGTTVRACIPYLNERYGNIRQYRGVHPVFLMCILRISDYLQLQAERAPESLLKVTALRSPISSGEWAAHSAVRDITAVTEDPEALLIIARPENVRTFLKLRNWLDGIQGELDLSWAILGEVFGRYTPLDSFGIALRRVRSNLDNLAAFAASISYIPLPASFSTADAALLKLLVAPLYGDHPEIGIRELIQNAVDATRERLTIEFHGQDGASVGAPDSRPQVRVEISRNSENEHWLEVQDGGIGMTAEIVVDYYLKAGASFRVSDTWRKMFETEAGDSRVLRSGRFGVGAVAAFLLGDRLEVETRHVHAPSDGGIAFHASLDDDVVELRKVECPVGTTIRVRLRKELARRFQRNAVDHISAEDWDWYVLDRPTVKRIRYGSELLQRQHFPEEHASLSAPWHRSSHSLFSDIQWTFSTVPSLVCNGIPIVRIEPIHSQYDYGPIYAPPVPTKLFEPATRHYRIYYPALSVFDPNANLPLNLQRTGIVDDEYPFSAVLRADVIDDIIAHFAVSGPPSGTPYGYLAETNSPVHPGIRFFDSTSVQDVLSWSPVYETGEGLGFVDADLVASSPIQSALIIGNPTWRSPYSFAYSLQRSSALFRASITGNGGIHALVRRLLYPVFDGSERLYTPFARMNFRGCRIAMDADPASTARKKVRQAVAALVNERRAPGKWVEWTLGECDERSPSYQEAVVAAQAHQHDHYGVACVAEVFFRETRETGIDSEVAARWQAAFQSPIIPPGVDDRIRLLGPSWAARVDAARADHAWFREQMLQRRGGVNFGGED